MQITLTATGTPEELAPLLVAAAMLAAPKLEEQAIEATKANAPASQDPLINPETGDFNNPPDTPKRGRRKSDADVKVLAAEYEKPVQDSVAAIQACVDQFAAEHEANKMERSLQKAIKDTEAAVSGIEQNEEKDTVEHVKLDDLKLAAAPFAISHKDEIKAILVECGAQAPDQAYKLSALDPAKYAYVLNKFKSFK